MQALAHKTVIEDRNMECRWAPPVSLAENKLTYENMEKYAPKIDLFFLDNLERRDPNYLHTAVCAFACGNGGPRDDHKA